MIAVATCFKRVVAIGYIQINHFAKLGVITVHILKIRKHLQLLLLDLIELLWVLMETLALREHSRMTMICSTI